jgi:hypothetical protein
MQDYLISITAGIDLSSDARQELDESGFTILPGPTPAEDLAQLAAAYDAAVDSAAPADISIGSSTIVVLALPPRPKTQMSRAAHPRLHPRQFLIEHPRRRHSHRERQLFLLQHHQQSAKSTPASAHSTRSPIATPALRPSSSPAHSRNP